jgi:hypothetical protein
VTAYCGAPVALTLTSAGSTLDLMDQANGFRVETVDLGYPAVREDVGDYPGRRGGWDNTRLFGARAVTVTGWIVPVPGASRQAAWHAIAPYLDPAARPVLTFQIDGDQIPHQLHVRAAQFSSVASNPQVSPFQLGFKALDPVAYSATVNTAICWPTNTAGGRTYNLSFPRVYPASPIGGATTTTAGDQTVYPLLHLYGPASTIRIAETIWAAAAPTGYSYAIPFKSGYSVAAGDRLDIDCAAHTVLTNGDPGSSQYNQIDFANWSGFWPRLAPTDTNPAEWTLSATATSGVTQLQIVWQDAYLW